MVVIADKGNPNFFTTFKGRYELVPTQPQTCDTNVVMLSCTNDVQPIGDWTLTNYTANEAFALMPQECRPGKIVKIPVVLESGTTSVTILTVDVDGTMRLPVSVTTGKLFLSGVNYNISDNWY